jgi:uncharacterized protein (TIGR02145 family)
MYSPSTFQSYREVWTTKNFDGTTFRDGTPIQYKPTQPEWDLPTYGWCHVNGDPANNAEYGKLYNWYAAVGYINPFVYPGKQIAPYGWRLPELERYEFLFGTVYYATASTGDPNYIPMWWREIGTNHWNTDVVAPGHTSNNILGFTALGAGVRFGAGGPNPSGFARFKDEAWFHTQYNGPASNGAPIQGGFVIGNLLATYFTTTFEDVKLLGGSIRFVKENMNTPGVYGRPLIQYLGVWDYTTVLSEG